MENTIGSPFEIVDSWTVSMADVAANCTMSVGGELWFGDDAVLAVANPRAHKVSTPESFTIVTAEGGIEGMPSLDAPVNFSLDKSADGKSLVLVQRPAGMLVIIQ